MVAFKKALPYLVITVAILLVYGTTLGNNFLWDDEAFVLKNIFLTSWKFLPQLLTTNIDAGAGQLSNFYRPLQSLTHFLDVQIWGYYPLGHHLSNLVFFVGMCCGLYCLLLPLFGEGVALVLCLFFLFHPLQANPVGYVSGRGDILGMLFLFWGLVFFYRNIFISLLCAFLAMASKESLALFPLFLFLYHRLRQTKWIDKRFVPFALLSVAYMLLRVTVLNFQNTLNFYNASNVLTENADYRLYTYFSTLPKGLLLWLWPYDLHHERSWGVYASLSIWPAWFGAAIFVCFIAAINFFWKRSKPIAVGLAWFLLATIPTSNLFVLINAIFYDHWFILPGLGLLFLLGLAFEKIKRKQLYRRITLLGLVVYVGVLLVFTVQQNRAWHNSEALFSHILQWEPNSVKSMNNLAMEYTRQDRFEEAILLYQKAIATDNVYANTHHNLAIAFFAQGQFKKALSEFNQALDMNPKFIQSLLWMGRAQLELGNKPEAKQAFERALAINPNFAEAKQGLQLAN